MTQPQASLQDALDKHFGEPPKRLAVAVSGGSDSTALLVAMAEWACAQEVALYPVTVNHGLRAEAGEEAQSVARLCAALELSHKTLLWQGWDGRGNLPDAARRARYDLIAEWALGEGVRDLVLGHTQNDQAETFIMRLARGAGLDGLAGMSARTKREGMLLHRPFLGLARETLRDFLRLNEISWSDDPSNEDTKYARVKTRAALDTLTAAGVEVETLAKVTGYLREARQTLAHVAGEAADRIAQVDAGDLLLDRMGWGTLRPDIQRRLIQAALRWVSGQEYPARGAAVEALMRGIAEGEPMTLHGCRVLLTADRIRVTREWAAVAGLQSEPGEIWDGRWRVNGPFTPEDRVSALGEAALGLCPDRREAGLPAASLIASPAVWRNGALIAAPLAGLGQAEGWSAECLRSLRDFNDTLLSH